jgi:hypothetical protein
VLNLDGERLLWSDAEKAGDSTKEQSKRQSIVAIIPPHKRRKKISTNTTGVGKRGRITRSKNLALNLGMQLKFVNLIFRRPP